MKSFVYSPHPAERYRVPVPEACSVRAIAELPHPVALWNMLWLSVPSVDHLLAPIQGEEWIKWNRGVALSLPPLIRDVVEDDELALMLTRQPDEFIAWFQSQDQTIFDAHDALGDIWVETVLDRAEQAARRLLKPRQVVRMVDNVLHFDFGRVF